MRLDQIGETVYESMATHSGVHQLRYFQLRVGGKCISAIPDPTTRGIEDVYKQSMVRDLRSFCVSVCYPSSCHTMVGIDAQL